MYQEQVPSYKHLDEPLDMLDEGRFVFECILAGNLQAFTTCETQLSCSRDCTVHNFVWLSLFLEILFLVTK